MNKNWLKFLAGWSLVTAIVVTCLILAILWIVIPASNPNPLGEKYFELIAASKAPALYSLTIMFDVITWICWGGLFVAVAALLRKTAPIKSTLIFLLATGMSIGFLGACLRLVGTPQFATQYLVADTARQPAIIQSYDSLLQIINTTFSAGGLLAGIALVLIASSAKHLPELGRWPVMLAGVAGTIHLAKAVFELMMGIDLGPLALLANVLLIVSLIAIACRIIKITRLIQVP